MYICLNCNYRSEDATNFCPNCGQPMGRVVQQSAGLVPVNTPAVVSQEIADTEPKTPLVKKIVGMALSIEGLATGVAGILYALLVWWAASVGVSDDEYLEVLIYAFTYAIIGLISCIVGLALSISSGADGKKPVFSRVGKICGIIGIVLA